MGKHSEPRAVPLSRRAFLATAGGVSVAVAFGGTAGRALAAMGGPLQPNAWMSIATNGMVTIMFPSAEMGQGVMTALPAVIADEMDADWSQVHVVQSPSNFKLYGNPGFGGIQATGASRTTQSYFAPLRLAGAQARKVLIATAAAAWKVPEGEISTEAGKAVHAKTKRTLTYGQLARRAKVGEMPKVTAADLKPADKWRYIGKGLDRVDVPLKVNGKAVYGMDVQVPGMLFGAVLRPPVQGEKPEKVDDAAAKAVKGVIAVVPLPYGVGIVGTTVEATKSAKAALKVEWSKTAKARTYTSGKIAEDYMAVARDASKAGVAAVKKGDVAKAMAGAAKTLTAEFVSEHVTHACMEPMNCTAKVTGDKIEVWAPTQAASLIQIVGGIVFKTKPENITVNVTYLGGGFGRRFELDFVFDAIILSKVAGGKPVKVIWSREDDIQNDKFRPLTAQRFQIGLDANGDVVGWHHRLVAESIFARVDPQSFNGRYKGDDPAVDDGAEPVYGFPAKQVDYLREQRGVDVGFWRAVGCGYTKFGIEVMVDEVARAKKMDPVAYRLALLKDAPRAAAMVKAAAEMAGWDKKRDNGRVLGIAYADFGPELPIDSPMKNHCAQVVEVSFDRNSGEVRVHNVWCAVDPGVAVNPKIIEAQIESSVAIGLGATFSEEITIKDGEVQQTNFDSYQVLRMKDMPEVHTKVMPSMKDPPSGIGEVGVPPLAPAIANAIAGVTGAKFRHLPMTPDRVKAALKV
ncbi:MAG: xanthine dehydrogenase family protein molybdopterin-binding subunit [Rhodospirillaceae bacterium]|nr:xanthine dehydrogenase family protein molybdopterin-binding subunit [Rhodospirillaceae bacterium]